MKYTPSKSNSLSYVDYEKREENHLKIYHSNKIKNQDFNPRLYVTSSISESEVLLIKEAFDYHDTNGSGKLTPNDLKVALLREHFNATKETAYNIIAEYDEECIGGLNFSSFMKIISSDPRESQSRSQLQKVFKKYDKQNKGYFTKENLEQVIRSEGQSMSQIELDKLWYKLDRQNRGKIDLDRFCEIMHHPNSIH